MRDRIEIEEALRLYRVWRNWREVARRMFHKSGIRFAHDAVQAAVRRHDLRVEQ